MTDCPDCGQPMLPPGETKRPNEYDHASGCPAGLRLGDRVRIMGEPPYGGVVGTIGRKLDCFGRFGVVPERPLFVFRKRGAGRAFVPIWCVPGDLAREAPPVNESAPKDGG